MKPLRVALLTWYPLDSDHIPGGLRVVSYNLVQALRCFPDLELHVVYSHSDIPADHVQREDGPGFVIVHYLAAPRRGPVPSMLHGLIRVRKVLHQLCPDVVNAHAAHYATAALWGGYPTVLTIHGVAHREAAIYRQRLSDRLAFWLTCRFAEYAISHVSDLVAISPYVQREYQSRARHARWHRIDNPLPDRYFALQDRAVKGRVLMPGSITEVKDPLTLARAMVILHQVNPVAHLHIAGRVTSVACATELQRYLGSQNLPGVIRLLGLLSQDELQREYEEAAVVALSSRQENAPMAVIEAMAAGKPVVASQVGGVPDLVSDEETGIMVPPGDPEALAKALARLLADDELRRRMGQRAREIAWQRFRAEAVAARYREVYYQVAGRQPPG